MLCPHCHQEVNENDQFCIHCGNKIILPLRHCPNCGERIHDHDYICSHCGYELPIQRVTIPQKRYKRTAIMLAILLGGLGIHNFYLGYSSKGFFQIVLFVSGLFTIGFTTFIAIIWGIVDALMICFGIIERDGNDNLLI